MKISNEIGIEADSGQPHRIAFIGANIAIDPAGAVQEQDRRPVSNSIFGIDTKLLRWHSFDDRCDNGGSDAAQNGAPSEAH